MAVRHDPTSLTATRHPCLTSYLTDLPDNPTGYPTTHLTKFLRANVEALIRRKTRLKGIINFFKGSDDELDAIEAKLDALEKAADERIAAKEAYLAKLTENVQQKQQEVNQLKQVVKRYENAINRVNN